MELNKIENLLEKYFQGETTIAEEKELREYFSSPNVAQHLEQYKSMFGYFSLAKEQKSTYEIPLQTKKRNVAWLSIAASAVILLGIGTYYFASEQSTTTTAVASKTELGTYDDPEEALKATQKALALLSNNVNVGIESVQYIKEYEQSKNKIFKQ
ncbi:MULTISPECIES: hypothetical protein [unclassified Flavobacterium]|jgi:hypothetical protein|uniref:hypothetical protein n=1 Tax=unclassified Flavobacterium TaxID=196869 RepID=UPI000709B153|nr:MULTISPECIES: hypothetical protein [unclassified Flavobacterium]KRD59295.1 hypothetical protein ASE40_14045 [Flavobacterium sp. Root935]TDX09513.1 hypothetical protein EDB96_3814 [Flavobacterium sp. S87F.05.LMB.W.Kidney.N]BDU23343.1 hypothetical protein FLGSB24_00870 [Flavobacterium sp. GSB-24]